MSRKHERAAHPHLNPQKPKPFKISSAAAAAPPRGHQEGGGGGGNTDPSSAGKRAAQASSRQREIYLHTDHLHLQQGSNPHLLTVGQATSRENGTGLADNSHLAYAAVNRQNGGDGTSDSRHHQFFNPVRN
jgi:hypothetical protein